MFTKYLSLAFYFTSSVTGLHVFCGSGEGVRPVLSGVLQEFGSMALGRSVPV